MPKHNLDGNQIFGIRSSAVTFAEHVYNWLGNPDAFRFGHETPEPPPLTPEQREDGTSLHMGFMLNELLSMYEKAGRDPRAAIDLVNLSLEKWRIVPVRETLTAP